MKWMKSTQKFSFISYVFANSLNKKSELINYPLSRYLEPFVF